MSKKKFPILAVSVLLLAIAALAACQQTPEVVEVTRVITETVVEEGETVEVTRVVTEEEVVEVTRVVEQEVEEEEEVEVVDRTGTWVDTVVVVEEPNADAAVSRLLANDIDIYAYTISSPETVAQIDAAGDQLKIARSFGSYNELTMNPAVCDDGSLNPFSEPAIREAMNWAVDRNHLVDEILGGLGSPRFVPINAASADRARFAAEIRAIEAEYAYDMDRAQEVIAEEMEALGATMEDGVWTYEGAPVELTALIRTEDERLDVGDYVSNQLEELGFNVVRDYRTSAEASPIWFSGDPATCDFHFYTGGWVSTAISRDAGENFEYFYTPAGLPTPLWLAYTPTDEFQTIATRLANNDFSTLEERAELFGEALPLALQDSVRVWLYDRSSVAPYRGEYEVAADLSGSIYGTFLWPYTLRETGQVGGSVTWAMPSILTEPWNPLAGSNWIYDQALIRATGQVAAIPDPNTGLYHPSRLDTATITVQEDLPVGQTLDWLTLETAPEIVVPDDVWARWDATEQRFLTAGEVYTETETALVHSVVTYPSSLYDDVQWHDGSTFDAADIVMRWIMLFDRADENSAIFDEAEVPSYQSFISSFKGFAITSEDPLTIEYYTDLWQLDAEAIVGIFGTNTAQWPYYGFGEAPWHTVAVGVQAEANELAAFSSDKSEALDIERISYLSGPTIETLTEQLEALAEEGTIPYEPTLGEFITAEEAAERYANLQDWHSRRGHYWVGTGPFFMRGAFPVEGNVILERNPNFPDPADRWSQFAEAPLAEVEVDGPGNVTAGQEAVFDVFVDFEGEPYPVEDIASVTYLLFDATGEMVATGDAEAVEDGLWEIVLSSDTTEALEAGSTRLEVVVASNVVALPSLATFEFVTTQ
ncbi:MAG TPA: ABC transporter substrate-binding protein [Candidatus Sulfomarinibacteraceae bacterium]|nr:ABC transporter substrate-binding protein [Candidatus Sulfomarinibacteraceae bacterium]